MSVSWYTEETFWVTWAPYLFDEKRWAEVPGAVDSLLEFYGNSDVLQVLDTCCGPGRFTLEFARRGHAVTAVDVVQSFLSAIEDTASDEHLQVTPICKDILRFEPVQQYDIVLNLYTSFGYFEHRRDDLTFLRMVHKALKPGGWFFLELTGKEICARYFSEGEWFEKDKAVVCTQFFVDDGWEYLNNRWIVCKDGKKTEHSWKLRLYSSRELELLLYEAGFTLVRTFGSFEFVPYDHNAKTLLIAARK